MDFVELIILPPKLFFLKLGFEVVVISFSGYRDPLFFYVLVTSGSYLIFVIFFTHVKFLESKIYTEKRQFVPLNL